MSYSKRFLEKTILDWFATSRPPYHTLLLAGARQCGKSTLLKHLFPEKDHWHLNLALDAGLADAIDQTQSFKDFQLLLANRLNFRLNTDRILIIDEAQLSVRLGGYVRFFKEKWQSQRVILTGSTLSSLFAGHENPTGRVIEFTLRPFNFQEFLAATHRDALLDSLLKFSPENPLSQTVHHEMLLSLADYLRVGGLPEVVLAFHEGGDFERLLGNIYALYKRDFSHAFSENLTTIMHQCFQRIAAATGSPIKLASIIRSSSPGYHKVANVLQALELWHLILKLECETSELSQIATVTPKRYIFDHGIRHFQNPARFAGMNLLDGQDMRREEWGGLIENFVMTELLSLNPVHSIKSWSKTHQAGHVDFIYTSGKQTRALEVKAALQFNRKHLSGLLSFHQKHRHSELVLVNLDRGGRVREGTTALTQIPAYAVFQYLS